MSNEVKMYEQFSYGEKMSNDWGYLSICLEDLQAAGEELSKVLIETSLWHNSYCAHTGCRPTDHSMDERNVNVLAAKKKYFEAFNSFHNIITKKHEY